MLNIDFLKNQIANANVTEVGEFLLLLPNFLKENGIDNREKIEAWLKEEKNKVN